MSRPLSEKLFNDAALIEQFGFGNQFNGSGMMHIDVADRIRKGASDLNEAATIVEIAKEHTQRLRDQFAMAALQGMLACPDPQTMGMGYHQEYSEAAYQYADAMLEARKDEV